MEADTMTCNECHERERMLTPGQLEVFGEKVIAVRRMVADIGPNTSNEQDGRNEVFAWLREQTSEWKETT